MTVGVLIVCSALCAWAAALAVRCDRRGLVLAGAACRAHLIFFGAIAIGAGIQLTFRG